MKGQSLRVGDLVRPRWTRRAVVYGVKLDGGGRLVSLLVECFPPMRTFGVTKRGAFSHSDMPVIGHDLEIAAMAWDCFALDHERAAQRVRRDDNAAAWRRLAARARLRAARIRRVVERAS